jgi:thiol-disulfide isomerase/thioredoxin/outer membrane lipoprotein-sorting protein
MKALLLLACTVLIVPMGALARVSHSEVDPLILLNHVATTYANADTFHIEAIEEKVQVSGNQLSRSWQKTFFTGIRRNGNRFYLESRSGHGSYIQVADGKTEWLYDADTKQYVERPVAPNGPTFSKDYDGIGGLANVWAIPLVLETEAVSYKSAKLLSQQTIHVGSHDFACYVVYVTSDDSKKSAGADYHFERTYWIDKGGKVVRKVVDRAKTSMPTGGMALEDETTILYPVADFPSHDADDVFNFRPPREAVKVATLDPTGPSVPHSVSAVLGRPAPKAQILAGNGTVISLGSYRGKPVLIDFWATWCGPCVMRMPDIERLYALLKNAGLTVISIDEDADAQTATAFLARHQYTWTNYHDQDGELQKAFRADYIPLTVLIDAEGTVTFDSSNQEGLRAAIARLSPHFASLIQ